MVIESDAGSADQGLVTIAMVVVRVNEVAVVDFRGNRCSFIGAWVSIMLIVPRVVDERIPSLVFIDCQ